MTHAQAQAADDDQTQPPVVEDDGARDDGLVVAVPIDDDRQDQGGKADGFDDGNEGVVAEIAHDGAVHAEADEERDCDYRRAGEKPEMDP